MSLKFLKSQSDNCSALTVFESPQSVIYFIASCLVIESPLDSEFASCFLRCENAARTVFVKFLGVVLPISGADFNVSLITAESTFGAGIKLPRLTRNKVRDRCMRAQRLLVHHIHAYRTARKFVLPPPTVPLL